MIPFQRVSAALRQVTEALLAESYAGPWVGELSSSALSTATALIAFSRLSPGERGASDESLVARGVRWLVAHQNADGGWGDTILSRSNISTTALVWAALGATGAAAEFSEASAKGERWLQRECGAEGPGWESILAEAIRRRYGKDRTFSVPILMACTLAGRLGPEGWSQVPPLPFELAALPHQLFGLLRLPVVSYALPALIAIGQVIHHFAPTRNFLWRLLRDGLRRNTLQVLESLQPCNGGFLEATPLTSFVLMSLAAMGADTLPVSRRAASFLRGSVREDGSWPIDTNLSTWVSTLSVQALSHQPQALAYEQKSELRQWLLGQQYRVEHPYTHAAPGGWAWTNLPGGVPDADDTASALLALLALGPVDVPVREAGHLGVRWLLGLQNSDGGIPTFCRGWGALPFDRSSPDITAHALRAWSAWLPQWPQKLRRQVESAIQKALRFLEKTQTPEGCWVPLWFGNEAADREENRTYGTARVLLALRELRARGFVVSEQMIRRAERALLELQLACGGWGGAQTPGMTATFEETALAIEALAGSAQVSAFDRGVAWLVECVERGGWREPAPIGFYFAKLWYFERLYPLIHGVAALGGAVRTLSLQNAGEDNEPASQFDSDLKSGDLEGVAD